MNKMMWLWIGVVTVVIIAAAAAVWLLLNTTTKQEVPVTTDESAMNMDQPAKTLPDAGQNTSASSDAQSGNVAVSIQDMAYSPAKITVKKGATVTWTNKDSIGHNAVGDSAQAGGLPTDAHLLSQGQTQSFTFNTVGVFTYHCTPHPFMQGTVQVVE